MTISIAERVAQLLADPTFEPELKRMAAPPSPPVETWADRAARLGYTDGKPADAPRKPANVDFRDSVNTTAELKNGSVGDRSTGSLQEPLSPTEPNIYTRPLRPREYRCENDRNLKLRLRSDLQPVRTRFACKDCVECVGYWRYCKRHRYEWGIDGKPLQTVVTVSGLADDNVASNVAVAIGRAAHGQRVVFLYRDAATFRWVAVVVYADALGERDVLNIERGRARYGQECTIAERLIIGAELSAWLPCNKRTEGGHKPCRFVDWGKVSRPETEYGYGDGEIIDVADAPADIPYQESAPIDAEIHVYEANPIDTDAKCRAKLRARNRIHIGRWLGRDGVTLDIESLLALRSARMSGQRGHWFGCIAGGVYHGPKRLIIDLALALDVDGMIPLAATDAMRYASAFIVEGE